jgi:hypothetical protein
MSKQFVCLLVAIVGILSAMVWAQSSTATGPTIPARMQVTFVETINSAGPTNGLSFIYVIDTKEGSGNPCLLIVSGNILEPKGAVVVMPTAAPCQAK